VSALVAGHFRSTAVRLGVAAAVLAGVGVAVAGCSGSSSLNASGSIEPSASVSPTTSAAPSSGSAKPHRDNGVAGQVTAENGDTWTLTTKAGKQIAVTITGDTVFGTRKQPASASGFPVGSTVHVFGTVRNSTITATRIAVPQPKPATTPGQTAAAAPTG
jgi:hypothetical protein